MKYVPQHLARRNGRIENARVGAAAIRSGRSFMAVGVATAIPVGAAALSTSAFAEEAQPTTPTKAADAAAPAPVLAFGSKGDDVKKLQASLALVRDGWFGPVTTAAVKDFQQANGLEADGIVGPKTWAQLAKVSVKADAPDGTADAVLNLGDQGPLVRAVQVKLGVPADGVFGPVTEAAVRAFQSDKGLVVDGIVGVRTTYALAQAEKAAADKASADKASGDKAADAKAAADAAKTAADKAAADKAAADKAAADKAASDKAAADAVARSIVDPNAMYELPFPAGQAYRISQGPFGAVSHHKVNDKHHVDFAMPVGSTVVSSAAGTVYSAGPNVSGGNVILIRDASGYCMEYAHLSTIGVTPGQHVEQGQIIARSGNTGHSTGPHLHWGIVDCSNFTSIKIADTVELGTSYIPGVIAYSRND